MVTINLPGKITVATIEGQLLFKVGVYINHCGYTIDLENFGVKKLHKAQTSTKLKHTRFFYYDNFTFE